MIKKIITSLMKWNDINAGWNRMNFVMQIFWLTLTKTVVNYYE